MPLGHQNDLGKLPANMALVENRWSLSFDGDDYLEIHEDDDEAFSGRLAVSTLSLAFWVKPANLDDKYDYDVELEMRISYFLDGGGTELGYTENEYPDPADFEDVIINEIKLETYKQLTFGDE